LKKEKEKERKEKLKKEGKLLNKGERERLARNTEFLENLKRQDHYAGLFKENSEITKKKVVYKDRKKVLRGSLHHKEEEEEEEETIQRQDIDDDREINKTIAEQEMAPDSWENTDENQMAVQVKTYSWEDEEINISANVQEKEENISGKKVSNNITMTEKNNIDSFSKERKESFVKRASVSENDKLGSPQLRPVLNVPKETPKEIMHEELDAERDADNDDEYDESSEKKQKLTVTMNKIPATMKHPITTKMPIEALNKGEEPSLGSENPKKDDEEGDRNLLREKELIRRKEEAKAHREQRYQEALVQRSRENLRSPICCVLGHVDTGKTKLLDKIRQTNVQEGEAGGITQQIGATYFPSDTIQEKTACLKEILEIKVPGLLIIDTPGHESFTNLRSRGSSLCNIAILVVDIMHGLEPQTIESLNLLRQKKTPFIVALNKIDRCYDWQSSPNGSFIDNYDRQPAHVKNEFEDRLRHVITAFAEQGLNAELYTRNSDMRRIISLIPTSAITGEGIPDLLKLLVELTQKMMSDKLMYLTELECTVLEVKVISGLGTTIDVILSNGVLREGDTIILCGLNGPIVTTIRALLTPQPCRELRIKSAYIHHKEVKASLGVKVCAPDLDKAIAGSRLIRMESEDNLEELKEEVMNDFNDLLLKIDKSGTGVSVQASTLGSLEALLEFLRTSNIPVSAINIGPVFRKDVMRAGVMLEHAREFATILAFDVKIEKEAEELAQEIGVRIFRADIIYHLFDQFTAYMKELQEQKRADLAPQAVFPCILRIVPNCVFNKRDPIIVGVDVVDGVLKIGTPLCIPSKDGISLGKVSGIENNHKPITVARKGQQVAIKIECPVYENPRMFGRHFEQKDDLISKISRESIDILKENFRNEMSKEDWLLVIKLKSIFNIP
jgi:translation initiation factor 5B